MKQVVRTLVQQALVQLIADGVLPSDVSVNFTIDRCKDPSHGDFATNAALMSAKAAKCKPRDLAEKIVAALPAAAEVAQVSIAGPGFINFQLTDAARLQTLNVIIEQGQRYGQAEANGQKVLLEFVSANPTGPLHVGHGRGAAYGASLGNLLQAAGFAVTREYYVNDAGRQMDILATSVWLRYLQAAGIELTFPSNGYQGDYILAIAETLAAQIGDQAVRTLTEVFANVPEDAPAGDKEAHIDALIVNAKGLLGELYHAVHKLALHAILDDIKADLGAFGVHYDEWFSEATLLQSGAVSEAMATLLAADVTFEENGAEWFKATKFGDDKDRVLRRANGQFTYFGVDVAYHLNKFKRGFDTAIDVWGADHHGYVARVKAALTACKVEPERLHVPLVQFAVLYRGGEKVAMSTRSGSFVTLRELREEVGNDAARYFYVARKADQHMDFDLDLAKSQSNDNPVYYIQYAHARVCSVERQLQEKGYSLDQSQGLAAANLLDSAHEQHLLQTLQRYPELVMVAAKAREPHQIAQYCRDLAHAFHSYYNAYQFIVVDDALRNARMMLALATKQVLRNAMDIIGVSAPEKM